MSSDVVDADLAGRHLDAAVEVDVKLPSGCADAAAAGQETAATTTPSSAIARSRTERLMRPPELRRAPLGHRRVLDREVRVGVERPRGQQPARPRRACPKRSWIMPAWNTNSALWYPSARAFGRNERPPRIARSRTAPSRARRRRGRSAAAPTRRGPAVSAPAASPWSASNSASSRSMFTPLAANSCSSRGRGRTAAPPAPVGPPPRTGLRARSRTRASG